MRAYKIAMTPPAMPVLLVADSELQENPIPERASLRIPRLTRTTPPEGDSGAIAEAAQLLVAAERPVLVADRAARTPAGMMRLVELAETLEAPVIDQGGRMNFPTRHPLNHSERSRALVGDADVILGLELADFWGTINSFRDQLLRGSRSVAPEGVRLISISAGDLYIKSNYQDFQRYAQLDLAIAADAEATLPSFDRGDQASDQWRSTESARGPRRQASQSTPASSGAGARGSSIRLGIQSDQHRPLIGGTVGTDQKRGLGARGRRTVCQPLAHAAVGF